MLTKGSTAMDLRLPESVDVGAVLHGSDGSIREGRGSCGCFSVLAGVRCKPSGPISNAQASMTAMTNPSDTSKMTSVVVQSGRFNPGNTVEVTSITTQPAMA